MSYSIQSGIHELEEKLRAERVIAERFPDAVLETLCDGNRVWMSESAAVHTTDLYLAHSPKAETGAQHITVYTYLTVEKMRVFARPSGYIDKVHYVWLDELKTKHPEAYTAMVNAAR